MFFKVMNDHLTSLTGRVNLTFFVNLDIGQLALYAGIIPEVHAEKKFNLVQPLFPKIDFCNFVSSGQGDKGK